MVGEDIVYHGSPSIDIVTGKFKKGKTGYLGPGIYFSAEKDYTTRYAKKYGSGAIYEVEILLQNPLIITSDNPTKEFLTAVYGTETVYLRRERKQSNICYLIETKDIKKFLSLGYDGVIWDFAGNKEYVVYDNSKIKILNKELIQENKNNGEEVTFYRFMSEMKGFLGRLLKDPIGAQPSNFLKEHGFSKTRIINLLLKKDILERNEKILTPDKTGEEKVKYAVTYKVKRKDFERKMKRIHSRYFEKNLPEKQEKNEKPLLHKMTELEECDGGAMGDGGATSAVNSGQYVQPLGGVQRRKTIYMTETQIKYIAEHLKKNMPILPRISLNGNIFSDRNLLKEVDERLLEGVFKTYDFDKVIKHLCQYLNFTNNWQEFKENSEKYNGFVIIDDAENGENNLTFIIKDEPQNKELLSKCMSKCGYFLSNITQYIDGYCQIIYEKNHEKNSVNDVVKEHKYIYHLTLNTRVEKIKRNGLCPKTKTDSSDNDSSEEEILKKEKGQHPSRIYFFLKPPSILTLMDLGQTLFGRENIDKMVVITIDTTDLDVDFYYDPDTKCGIYTLENIPPQNISHISKIDIRKGKL